jgi:hypothetical protein
LVSPNPQNVAMALQWVQAVEARGTTDILTPYQVATNMLANAAPQVNFAVSHTENFHTIKQFVFFAA